MKKPTMGEIIFLIFFMAILLILSWIVASNSAKEYGEYVCEVTTGTSDCSGIRWKRQNNIRSIKNWPLQRGIKLVI